MQIAASRSKLSCCCRARSSLLCSSANTDTHWPGRQSLNAMPRTRRSVTELRLPEFRKAGERRRGGRSCRGKVEIPHPQTTRGSHLALVVPATSRQSQPPVIYGHKIRTAYLKGDLMGIAGITQSFDIGLSSRQLRWHPFKTNHTPKTGLSQGDVRSPRERR